MLLQISYLKCWPWFQNITYIPKMSFVSSLICVLLFISAFSYPSILCIPEAIWTKRCCAEFGYFSCSWPACIHRASIDTTRKSKCSSRAFHCIWLLTVPVNEQLSTGNSFEFSWPAARIVSLTFCLSMLHYKSYSVGY